MSSQKDDREAHKQAWRMNQLRLEKERYDRCLSVFKNGFVYKRVHGYLRDGGIKEPYSTNCLLWIFDELYTIINNQK
jgi:hypothetical protein